MPQVDRVLDVQHRSRLDRMDAALRAIGRQLHVTATVSAVREKTGNPYVSR
jgi:hypothetical protein